MAETKNNIEAMEQEAVLEANAANPQADAPKKNAVKSEPSALKNDAEDLGPAVVKPTDSNPDATKKTKEVSGDPQQKAQGSADAMPKLKEEESKEGEGEKKDVKEESEDSIDVSADVAALIKDADLSETFKSKAATIFEAAVNTKVKEQKAKGGEGISLTEADWVVSAGRGLKGPENWGMIEELATELGAATACSRPVADIGWRPHHEHVGQTGIAIRPNLYIAVGISGAIQHLAGVNGSKVIVVVNTDPEAPFFKAADYGIVGDVFDVLPKLTAAVKAM